jgi:hypothetical protein
VAVLAAIATEGLTVDDRTLQRLEELRGRAEPEVRRFVDWAAGELADKLTKDFMSFGLPPMQARKEAQAAVTILCKRVLGAAKTWHQFHR